MSFSEYRNLEEFKAASGYEINGDWYPRITKIVSIKAKPALYRYYAAAPSFAVASRQTEKSAEEGTLVHEAIEKILIGKTPEVNPLIQPSIEAFQKFLAENDVMVIPEHIEMRVLHPKERYAGTIDSVAYLNGKFGVLDVKTSQAIYRDYALQTAAYMGAVKEIPALAKAETRWILRVDQVAECFRCAATKRLKGGREKIKRGSLFPCRTDSHDWGPVTGVVELKEFPDWENDYVAFLGAKKLWEWENEDWLKKAGYLS
jgi:hypothetical protein